MLAFGMPQDESDEEREDRRGKQGNEEVCVIAHLAEERAFEENTELFPFLSPTQGFTSFRARWHGRSRFTR